MAPTQVRTPAVQVPAFWKHCQVPVWQRVPVPVFWQSAIFPVGQQAVFSHESVGALSMQPLQSSSTPFQVSAMGPMPPMQLP
jgi:hypothetical protein